MVARPLLIPVVLFSVLFNTKGVYQNTYSYVMFKPGLGNPHLPLNTGKINKISELLIFLNNEIAVELRGRVYLVAWTVITY